MKECEKRIALIVVKLELDLKLNRELEVAKTTPCCRSVVARDKYSRDIINQ